MIPHLFMASSPGALKAYDLPDLAASLAPRKLMMVGATDGNGKKADQDRMDKDLAILKTAYQSKKSADQLKIVFPESTARPYDLYREWIK